MGSYKSALKKVSIAFAILFMTVTAGGVFSQPSHGLNNSPNNPAIIFSNKHWKAVAKEAKRTGKCIFVDAYTSWCGPCKLLKTTTFKDEKAANYYNKNFINLTVDMETGDGIALAEQWDITAYPALLFFNPAGEMILKQVGYVDGEQLVEFGKQALEKK